MKHIPGQVKMTMVKGLTEDAVKRLASLRTQVEQLSEFVDTRLESMLARLPEKS